MIRLSTAKSEEVAQWEKKCPVLRLRRYLEKKGLWDDRQKSQFTEEISKEITEAINMAKETSKPSLRSLVQHVYFEVPLALEKEYEELKTFFPNE